MHIMEVVLLVSSDSKAQVEFAYEKCFSPSEPFIFEGLIFEISP